MFVAAYNSGPHCTVKIAFAKKQVSIRDKILMMVDVSLIQVLLTEVRSLLNENHLSFLKFRFN